MVRGCPVQRNDGEARRRRLSLIPLLAALAAAPGCGREVLGVTAPRMLLAWAPAPAHPAQMTVVRSFATGVYAGFSNGEVFGKKQGSGNWQAFDSASCGRPKPSGPVSSFAVTADRLVISLVGAPGASTIWHSAVDMSCWASANVGSDIWSLSVSPFFPYELLATTAHDPFVTEHAVEDWNYSARPVALGFDGVATALATGVGDDGRTPRAWLGDAEGNIYFSDDVAAVRMAEQTTAETVATDLIHWHRLPSPGFPRRAVVAVVTDPDLPTHIWVTFASIRSDSIWVSNDNGRGWQNPHGGELPVADAAPGDAAAPIGDGGDAPPRAAASTFTSVSPIPGLSVAIVAALRPDANGNLTSTTFWIADGSMEWWKM